MNDPTRIINWVGLSQKLANNETSVSKNRCPKKYKAKVESLIWFIEEWAREGDESQPSIIEIDFDGHLKAQIQTFDTKPNVLKAVNGYGNPVDCKGVRINEV